MFSRSNYTSRKLKPFLYSAALAAVIEIIIFIFPKYWRLHTLNHLNAGLAIPYFIYAFLVTPSLSHRCRSIILFRLSCVTYLIGSIFWESWSFHGYMQWDQYLCDLTGVIVIYLLYRFNNRVRTFIDSISE